MLASSIPTKIILPFANNAGGAYINVVPVASQIGITNGAASFYDGFPPNCFVALAAGGAGPFGKDFNGLLNVMSAWERWYCAGGPVPYDSAFQMASQVGGYPSGAVVASATTAGLYWRSIADNNTTNPDTGGSGWVSFLAYGGIGTGCQLQYASSSSLLLAPYNGGFLWINGTNYPIPANLNLSNAGLSASTLYYIYAAMSSGMILEASTTAYALNAMGIPLKIGDATRSLVGMAYHSSVSTFNDSAAARNVVSWYNRRARPILGASATGNVSDPSPAEINTAMRVQFTTWADEAVDLSFMGTAANSAGTSSSNNAVVAIDSTVVGGGTPSTSPGAGLGEGQADRYCAYLSEGFHTGQAYGDNSAGTVTISGRLMGLLFS